MIGNLSGLEAVCFYGDSVRFFVMREQFVGRDFRESPVFFLFMELTTS